MRIIGQLIVTVCLMGRIAAGEAEALSWQDCMKEVRNQHPELISAQLGVEQAHEGLNSSKAGRLPSIGVSAGAGKSGDSDGSQDSYSAGVSASQLLFDAGKTRHAIGSARDSETVSMAQLDEASATVRENLRGAFVSLIRAQQLVEVVGQIAERRRQSLELVTLRYEAGREHHGSLLTAEANLARAEMDIRSAQRDIQVAQASLAMALGRDELSVSKVTGELSLPVQAPGEPDFSELADEHPALRQLKARRSSAEHGLARIKAEGLPSAKLSAQTGLNGADWPPDDDSWSVGVGVSLPLFEGGSRMAAVRSNKASVEVARQDELAGRMNIESALVQAWTGFSDAIDAVAVQEKFLEAAEERAAISKAQYSSGLLSFDNWIIIEDELVRSMTSLLDARAAALKAEARWIHARGGTLDDE
jgi:outer membrane protein TolC